MSVSFMDSVSDGCAVDTNPIATLFLYFLYRKTLPPHAHFAMFKGAQSHFTIVMSASFMDSVSDGKPWIRIRLRHFSRIFYTGRR